MRRRSGAFGQQFADDHEIVGEHRAADEQGEALGTFGAATLHAATAHQHRDAPFDAGAKTLALLERRRSFVGRELPTLTAPCGCGYTPLPKPLMSWSITTRKGGGDTSSASTVIGGPELKLTAPATEAVAVVIQGLATTALKHGALSTPDGTVSVSWHCRLGGPAATCLVIEWLETGGPLTVTPARSGYGTTLIRELIPHERGGSVDLVFAPEGLSGHITIPLGDVLQ